MRCLRLRSSDFLFHQYPQMPEGKLTKLRASIVCEPTLALCAREIHLEQHLLLGKGEETHRRALSRFNYIRCYGSTDRGNLSGRWFC